METTLISKPVFRWFLLNYTDFVHKISHTKPSKYDSTSGTKISIIMFEKNWGGGGWGYGSEQAPRRHNKSERFTDILNDIWNVISDTFTWEIQNSFEHQMESNVIFCSQIWKCCLFKIFIWLRTWVSDIRICYDARLT